MKITLNTLKSMELYQRNALFYDTVIENNLALVNMKNGFLLYFYTLQEKNFKDHKEFEHYPKKLEKIQRSIEAIAKIKLESRLNIGYTELLINTEALLQKDEITTTDLTRYTAFIGGQEDAIFENDLLDILNKLKNEISDLRRNLPEMNLPTIIETYVVSYNGKSDLAESKIVPFEMKRPPMKNSLVLPADPNPELSVIWTGYSVGPMMGNGTEEIWKQTKGKWQFQSSKRTWVS